MTQTFNEYWDAFGVVSSSPGLSAAFREVAEKAWNAARVGHRPANPDVRQDKPLAYMVIPLKSMDYDYMVFPTEIEAQDYAMEQEEEGDVPKGSCKVYPLWC